MTRLLRSFNRSAARLRPGLHLQGTTFRAPTFDRLLYLFLHRIGAMGGASRRRLQEIVRPGMVCLDVGANIGIYSVEMSRATGPTGRVVSFEPDPLLFASLQENTANPPGGSITCHCLALSDQAGTAHLVSGGYNSGDNHLVAEGGEGTEVSIARLDALDLGPIDFVKIDVQGWEPCVLGGMQGILTSQQKPLRLLMEFWPVGLSRAGFEPRRFLEELRQNGWLDAGTGAPFEISSSLESLLTSRNFIDLDLVHPCQSSKSAE
jgi:FkbM family methyltransferase